MPKYLSLFFVLAFSFFSNAQVSIDFKKALSQHSRFSKYKKIGATNIVWEGNDHVVVFFDHELEQGPKRGDLIAIEKKKSDLLWHMKTDIVKGVKLLKNGNIGCISQDSMDYLSPNRMANFREINPENGRVVREYKISSIAQRIPVFGFDVDSDENLFVFYAEYKTIDGDGFKKLSKFSKKGKLLYKKEISFKDPTEHFSGKCNQLAVLDNNEVAIAVSRTKTKSGLLKIENPLKERATLLAKLSNKGELKKVKELFEYENDFIVIGQSKNQIKLFSNSRKIIWKGLETESNSNPLNIMTFDMELNELALKRITNFGISLRNIETASVSKKQLYIAAKQRTHLILNNKVIFHPAKDVFVFLKLDLESDLWSYGFKTPASSNLTSTFGKGAINIGSKKSELFIPLYKELTDNESNYLSPYTTTKGDIVYDQKQNAKGELIWLQQTVKIGQLGNYRSPIKKNVETHLLKGNLKGEILSKRLVCNGKSIAAVNYNENVVYYDYNNKTLKLLSKKGKPIWEIPFPKDYHTKVHKLFISNKNEVYLYFHCRGEFKLNGVKVGNTTTKNRNIYMKLNKQGKLIASNIFNGSISNIAFNQDGNSVFHLDGKSVELNGNKISVPGFARIIQIDSKGDINTNNIFEAPRYPYSWIHKISLTNSGKIAVLGSCTKYSCKKTLNYCNNYCKNSKTGVITLLTSNGKILWQDSTNVHQPRSLIEKNGKLILAGNTSQNNLKYSVVRLTGDTIKKPYQSVILEYDISTGSKKHLYADRGNYISKYNAINLVSSQRSKNKIIVLLNYKVRVDFGEKTFLSKGDWDFNFTEFKAK